MERKPERQNNDKTAPQAGAQGSGRPAALLQTQAARRGSAFRQGLALLCDSPRRPPIVSRREFCLQAMLVAGRWLIALLLFYLLYSQFYTVQGDCLVRRPLPLALLLLGVIFLAFLGAQLAYFFVIYRRLRGLALARPGLLAWGWAVFHILLGAGLFAFANNSLWADALAWGACILPYLILMLFNGPQEKRKAET